MWSSTADTPTLSCTQPRLSSMRTSRPSRTQLCLPRKLRMKPWRRLKNQVFAAPILAVPGYVHHWLEGGQSSGLCPASPDQDLPTAGFFERAPVPACGWVHSRDDEIAWRATDAFLWSGFKKVCTVCKARVAQGDSVPNLSQIATLVPLAFSAASTSPNMVGAVVEVCAPALAANLSRRFSYPCTTSSSCFARMKEALLAKFNSLFVSEACGRCSQIHESIGESMSRNTS